MTCIAGIAEGYNAWMACDSAATNDETGHRETYRHSKVFRAGSCVMGYSGSFRLGQVAEHFFEPPTPDPTETSMAYLVCRFVPKLRKVLRRNGVLEGESMPGDLLVGFRGGLFTVLAGFEVLQSSHGFAAIGSGESYAIGSLHATHGSGLLATERLRLALAASAEFCASVAGPFHYYCLKG